MLRIKSTPQPFFPEYLYTQLLKDNYNPTQIKKLEASIKRIFKATIPSPPLYNSLKFLEVKAILPYLKRNKASISPFIIIINTLLKVPSGEITEVNNIPFKNQLKEALALYQTGIQPKSTNKVPKNPVNKPISTRSAKS